MSVLFPKTKIGIFIYVGLYLFILVGLLNFTFGLEITDYPRPVLIFLFSYWAIILFIGIPIAMMIYGFGEVARYRRHKD